jgi:hypothetical protein
LVRRPSQLESQQTRQAELLGGGVDVGVGVGWLMNSANTSLRVVVRFRGRVEQGSALVHSSGVRI